MVLTRDRQREREREREREMDGQTERRTVKGIHRHIFLNCVHMLLNYLICFITTVLAW